MLISSLRLIKVIQSTDNTMSSAYYKCICTQITGIDIKKHIFGDFVQLKKKNTILENYLWIGNPVTQIRILVGYKYILLTI